MATAWTTELEARLLEVVMNNRSKRGALLPVLREARAICGGLPTEALELVAEGLDLMLAQVAGTASFFDLIDGHETDTCATYRVNADGAGETRLLLKNVGKMDDPTSASQYAAVGGYEALKKALADPIKIIDDLRTSGLSGRGGAAFPVGLKWELVKKTPSDEKFVLCNACEGEPGTGKDRVLLEADPHAILEGMVICGVAVGANQGYMHIREDYTDELKKMEKAIGKAYAGRYLGKNILDSGFHFDIELRTGPGCYVCGEETGLIESVEGNRGEPRLKPPYPGFSGLWGKPTVINNLETFANIPVIMNIGPKAFRRYGTDKCPGTKLFTISGCVKNPGVYEFPMGMPLKEIYEKAGGCPEGKILKGIQTGGGSGTIIGADKLDTPMDIESCADAGISLGTGAMLFIEKDTSVPQLCLEAMTFMEEQSCGKCTPCRSGTRRIARILTRFCEQRGCAEDLNELQRLADYIKKNSLCGLGQTAPTAFTSALADFRHEFEALVN
jgi:NADH-quinone oxidoreductase subunit F